MAATAKDEKRALMAGRCSWVQSDDDKPEFGPPLFDERKRARDWRQFKKGFVWGFSLVGLLHAQFMVFQYALSPGKRLISDLVLEGFTIGSSAGMLWGGVEVWRNNVVIHKPALLRYKSP